MRCRKPFLLTERQVTQRFAPSPINRLGLIVPTVETQQRLRPQTQMQQTNKARLFAHLIGRETKGLLGIPESSFNGTITNDKFCMSRAQQLNLTWSRCPLRLRHLCSDPQTSSSDETTHPGGNHEAPLESLPKPDTT